EEFGAVQQSRQRLRRQGGLGARRRRFRNGDQAQSEIRRGVLQSRLGQAQPRRYRGQRNRYRAGQGAATRYWRDAVATSPRKQGGMRSYTAILSIRRVLPI